MQAQTERQREGLRGTRQDLRTKRLKSCTLQTLLVAVVLLLPYDLSLLWSENVIGTGSVRGRRWTNRNNDRVRHRQKRQRGKEDR